MKKRVIIGGITAMFLFAAVTLFVAAAQPFSASAAGQQQTGEQEEVEATQSGQTKYVEISRNLNGEELTGGVLINYEYPDEIPDSDADLNGIFVTLNDNTLTLGTGRIEVIVEVEQINDQDPVTTADASYDGDEVEVTFTDSTLFYKDTTEDPAIDREEIEAGEITVTRTLEPGSAGVIGENMIVKVWGSMVDGQLVAVIVVYESLK